MLQQNTIYANKNITTQFANTHEYVIICWSLRFEANQRLCFSSANPSGIVFITKQPHQRRMFKEFFGSRGKRVLPLNIDKVLNSISSTIPHTLCCYYIEMSLCWSVADIGDRVMVKDTVAKIPKIKRAQQHTNVTRRNKSWTWIDFGTFIYFIKKRILPINVAQLSWNGQ